MPALDFVIKHWKGLSVVVAIALAAFLGRITAPKPPPAVEIHQTESHDTTTHDQVRVVKEEGPVVIQKHIVYKTKVVPGQSQPCEADVTEDTTETHAPATTTATGTEDKHDVSHVSTDVKITPAPSRPGWAVGVGIDDPIGSQRLRLELDRRLMGNLWVGITAIPATRDIGVMLRMEF